MSQMFGMTGRRGLSDKEIAEDILTSQKYLSNYYYAPAILESADSRLRSTFQNIHADTQSEAKQVFDYLNAKGWYRPRQADPQTTNELRSTAQESRQIISSIANVGAGFGMPGGQWAQQPAHTSFPTGQGWQSVSTGWGGAQAGQQVGTQPGQWVGAHQGQWATQQGQWTGTQAGEGQTGMGPSSLGQGAKWGGAPSWTFTGGLGGSTEIHGFSQPSPGSFQSGQWPRQGWTGTEAGEGGPGQSSLYQGAKWGGQPGSQG